MSLRRLVSLGDVPDGEVITLSEGGRLYKVRHRITVYGEGRAWSCPPTKGHMYIESWEDFKELPGDTQVLWHVKVRKQRRNKG